eukprot:7352464-Ditylum_brightwellii.AAC.1
MTCNFNITLLSDSKATLQQEVSVLHFLAPDPESSTDDEIAATNRTAMIKDLADQSASRSTRVETKVNVLDAQKSKEDIMSCLAKWLFEFDYRFEVLKDGPTSLIHGIFSKLADILGSRKYKQWYKKMITKAPWIPQMHLEQMQTVMSTIAKLSTNHLMLKQVMDGKDISTDVLRTINDAASDIIRDINCCCEMET